MRLRVLPRDVAAGIITGAVASLGWAIGALTLVLAIPIVFETAARAGRPDAAFLPIGLILVMLVSLGLVAWRARPWAVAAYLVVGFVVTVAYELSLISSFPTLIDAQVYVLNRTAVALVLVGLAARTPLVGIAWSVLGIALSTIASVVVALISNTPFRPGFGPLLVLVVSLAAYLTLWGVQGVQRRRVPNIEELESEYARIARGGDLARRTTAAVHDTLLNDLSVVMNAPERLDDRARQRLRDDLDTLNGAEWLRESSHLTVLDDQDNSVRNELMRLISGFQWRGLSVHVTGNGDGIYRITPAAATALVEALAAVLENVAKHSGATVAELELVYTPEEITVMVTDEGVGFDTTAVPDDRLGIRMSIQARMERVGGRVQIWSSPGAGTSVVISAPVEAMVRAHDAPHHQDLG